MADTAPIRRAEPADAERLSAAAARLFHQAYATEMPARELSTYVSEAFQPAIQRSETMDPAVTTWVAERAGDIVGFAQLRMAPIPVPDAAPAEAELWRIYLDRSEHGSGLAAALLEVVFAAARDKGAGGIWLGVWEANARATGFYRKQGFEAVGHHEFRLGGETQTDIIMRASVP